MIRGLALGFVSALALASAANAADLSGGYKDAPQAAWVSSDILSANNQVGIAFATTHFDYLETSGGRSSIPRAAGYRASTYRSR